MLISQLVQSGISKLKKSNIPSPHLEADVLLSFILKKPKEFILSHGEDFISFKNILRFKLQIYKRIHGTPLAYLLKNKAFYNYEFMINSSVLIPRPETEMIVDEVLRTTFDNKFYSIIDVGTGSGCIIISLVKELLKSNNPISNFDFTAIDISKKALKTAINNAKSLNTMNINFLSGNLLEPILEANFGFKHLIITANLPYLTKKQIKDSKTIKKEPKIALIAGNDGLKYYEELFSQIGLLKFDSIAIYCEIDDTQAQSIHGLIRKTLPDFDIIIKKDYRGFNRLAIASK